MSRQITIDINDDYKKLDAYLTKNTQSLFLVCDNAINYLNVNDYFNSLESRLNIRVTRFSDFSPNPHYESVIKGIQLFRQNNCDAVFAVGGGSAMDVAKCIKLYNKNDITKNVLKTPIVENQIPLFALPTTAGTGSEATKYAVIYYNNEKQSITDDSIVPSVVFFDASVLKSLPEYQKKCTMLDALCHSIESFWSVNSTEESKNYSKLALKMIIKNMDIYLQNAEEGNRNMLEAANLAGKAINITQTTGGHAMCYKITSLFNVPHGYAAAMCDAQLWPYMYHNLDRCIDKRGSEYLRETFIEIAVNMGCETVEAGIEKFQSIIDNLQLPEPEANYEDIEILKNSVNITRLKNNPVRLDTDALEEIYKKVFNK